jgi:hypothetical protein
MNKIIIKAIMVLLVICTAQVLHAQDAPPPAAPPPATDTAMERLQKSLREYDSIVNDIKKRYSTDQPASGAVMKVGDKKDGGTVYWVDGTGKHGLIVWPSDLGIKKWEESVQACTNLGTGWHMATKDELDKLYKANITLKILASYFFFHSSTEESPGVVWLQSLSSGNLKTGYKTGTASTAAVKAF